MRYRLRTLLIVLAFLPPLLWICWTKYAAWKATLVAREPARSTASRCSAWFDSTLLRSFVGPRSPLSGR